MSKMQKKPIWQKVFVITCVLFVCLRVSNIAYADPVGDLIEAANLVVDTLTSVATDVLSAAKIAAKVTIGLYIGESLVMLGEFVKMANEGSKYDETNTATTQNNMTGLQNTATNNENNFTNQLANYNQPGSYPSSDENPITGKNVTYSANSANTLIGGNKVHSSVQEQAAQSYVNNASGAGIGISKPSETWRENTTPEAVRYNAYYNLATSNQSQTSNALVGLQSTRTKIDSKGNTTTSTSNLSSLVTSFSYCDPTSSDAFSAVKKYPLLSIGCMFAGVLSMAPTIIKMGFGMFESGVGMLGGLNSTATSAMNFSMLDPMHKQATDAAAGSEANAYKKSSS